MRRQRGMEEGSEAEIRGREFGLYVGEPVVFRFPNSSTGEATRSVTSSKKSVLTAASRSWLPVETTLMRARRGRGALVPVRLSAQLTEVGVLELWALSRDSKRRWKLEYNVRERPAGEPGAGRLGGAA